VPKKAPRDSSTAPQEAKGADGSADVRKRTIQELVYEELRRSLMTGVFTPGEKISLRRLTEQTGTSMMPVREAVNRLIAERALQVVPKRQVIVPMMTAEKFEEITRWRVELETAAARAACRKITPDVTSRLEQINARIVEAVQNDHKEELLPLNYEFHFTIYRAAQLEVLLPMIESLWLQAGPFTYYSTPSPRALWDVRHHRDMITALQRQDEEAAAEALSQDIVTASQFLKRSGHFAKPRVRQVFRRD
jgi:DNA-binding GntR family transcriptional regulator